ncbi:MAG: strawberry notch-like NTP hydrolase domain-containing protein, partial [bacterium]
VSDYFAARLKDRSYNNITEARKEVENAAGIKIEPDSLQAKELEEAIEVGIVKRARQIVDQGMDAQQTYDALVDLYQRQPTLGKRTSTSMAQQAYSTPAPVAYTASRLAGINKNTVVYDPAAGNGMLLMEADPSRAVVNELNTDRARNLDRLGFSPLVEDATQLEISQKPGVVIANPPFGKVKEQDGSNRVWNIGGYETTEVDHAVSLKALEEMAPDGRAVLIIGGKEGDAQSRAKKYRSPATRRFWNQLLTTYNVTGHYSLSGDLYKRQGAGFPIDIIVIDGYNNTGKPSKKFPGADVPPVIQSFDELKGVLDEGFAVSRQQEGVGAEGQRGVSGRVSAQKDKPAAQPGDISGAPGREGAVDDKSGGRGRGARGTGDVGHSVRGSGSRTGLAGGRQSAQESGKTTGDKQSVDTSRNIQRRTQQGDVSGASQRRSGTRKGSREPTDSGLGGIREDESVTPEGSEFQQTYTPASSLETMGTQVPRNMADTTAQALEDLENRRGRVDQFVADELGYDVNDLPNYFAAEQVDAIGLALDNIKQGFGFIIGDQTGIGKGRVNAAIIQYARKNNIMPVFVTYSPNLYADMVRDLNDIGVQGFEPLVTNAGLKGKHAIPLPDGRQIKTGNTAERMAEMGELQSKGFESGYDGVFTTYAQLQSLGSGETNRQQFLKNIAPRSLLILDESHNAGGSKDDRKAAQKDPNKMPRSVVVREALQESPYGAFYSSATYAKRPDVMGLYFKTDMSLAVDDIGRLSEAVEKGGVPLQQAVAAMLSESGQYIRRERSFKGVTFDQQQAAVDRQHPENASRIMQAVRRFDAIKERDVAELAEEAAGAGEGFVEDGAVGTAGMESTKFTSVMHNLIDQFLLATKAESAVQRALDAHNNGEKPVIAVANTMESFLDQYARINELENGDAVSLDFSALFNRYLERSREVVVQDPDGNKERHYLRDDELSSDALDAFDQAKKVIEETDFTGLPVSPIDYMLQRLEAEGLSVGELTGRNRIIRYNADFAGGVLSARKKPNTNQLIDDFNAGKTDALLLNSSGSTGLSIHSSENFSDRKKRRMIVAQPDKDINVFMQILGRVFRTGQVTPPAYELLHADIPAEKRPAAVLSQKMASLNANTTAGRKSDLSADTVDFFNEYGDEVVAQVMYDNREIHNKLGRPLPAAEKGEGFKTEDAVRKVTGRIPLLSLAEQEQLYDQIISEYQEHVEALEKMGISTLEAKTRDLQARTKKSIELTPARAERQGSPFAAASRIEEVSVRKLGKPYTPDEVKHRLAENLGADKSATLDELQDAGRNQAEQTRQRVQEQARKWTEKRLEAIEDAEKKNAFKTRADGAYQQVADIINRFAPGTPVEVASNEASYDGVVLNIEQKGRTDSPVAASDWKMTIALNDANRQVTMSFSRLEPGKAAPGEGNRVAVRQHESGLDDVLDAFEEGRSESRENRYMVTGNILAGFEAVGNKGQIINYTRDDGTTEVGVLLPKDIKINELVQN